MSDNVVVTHQLHKRYGSNVAVKALDMEVPKGAVFGLLGPNGAGKTTTFGILCGWLRATAGTAQVLGVDTKRLHTLRGRVSVLPQDAAFPPQISVHRQLTHFGRMMGLGAAKSASEADRVLELVGLREAGHLRGSELSHGMLKRVGLAQAILGTPAVIFLDEPTSGLDPKSARSVKDLVASLTPQSTVILSSHNLVDVQEICTHGAILNRGVVALAGTIDVLTRRGAEITVEIKPGAPPPLAPLRAAFGDTSVELQGDQIRVLFDPSRDVSDVIAQAVRIMLDHNVPMLGVRRGTSLETAFLEVTKDSAPTAAAS